MALLVGGAGARAASWLHATPAQWPTLEASMAHVAAGLTEPVARIRFPVRRRAVLHL